MRGLEAQKLVEALPAIRVERLRGEDQDVVAGERLKGGSNRRRGYDVRVALVSSLCDRCLASGRRAASTLRPRRGSSVDRRICTGST